MAEPDRSSPSTSRESSGGAMTSSSQQVREEQEENLGQENDHVRLRVDRGIDDIRQYAQPETLEQQNVGISFRGNFLSFEDVSAIRDDTWSCIIVVLTFWFFVSMTLILGVFGSTKMTLGPNASILIEPNPLFVQTVKVEELNEINPGPMVYAFYKSPPLDVATTWSESYNVSVPSDSHKDFIHFLNKGSQINISYNVKSSGSSVFLIIAQGNDGLAQWLQNPTYPNTTLSWNVAHGSGAIHQDIFTSSNYYVTVGNLNSEAVEVQLDVRLKAIQYNTSEAYYKCTFTQGLCSMSIFFPKGNAVVLTSPSTPLQGEDSDGWNVKVSYGPRWLTYCIGIGGMTLLMLVAFHFLNKFRCINEDDTGGSYGGMESARDPLLPYKDDDISSWGSSYDSASNDEEDIQEFLAAYSIEGKSAKEVDKEGNNTRRLCAICFDAPRDCFFLPCGHCVACFECGTRIAEAAGTCPICRRNMKKVRKIFTV